MHFKSFIFKMLSFLVMSFRLLWCWLFKSTNISLKTRSSNQACLQDDSPGSKMRDDVVLTGLSGSPLHHCLRVEGVVKSCFRGGKQKSDACKG